MRFLAKLKWWLFFRRKLWKYSIYRRAYPKFGDGVPVLQAFMLFCQLEYMGPDLADQMVEKYIATCGTKGDFIAFLRQEGMTIVADYGPEG